MRADHGDRHAILRDHRIGLRRRQLAHRLAERQGHRALPAGAEGQQGALGIGARNQGDAERHAVGPEAGRHGERRQAEEVHEVGVVAEMRIVEHRLALEIGQRVDRAGRRHGEEIEPLHLGEGARLEVGKAVLALEGVDGAVLAAAQHDLLRRRPDTRLLVGGLHERTDRGGALGDPGAAVEKLRGVAERCVVDLDRRAAQPLQSLDRLRVERGVSGIAEELGVLRAEDAEAERPCRWRASRAARRRRRGPHRHRRRRGRTPTCSRASGRPAPCLRC